MKKYLFVIFVASLLHLHIFSQSTDTIFQPEIKYNFPRSYEIAAIEVRGVKNIDKRTLLRISRLKVGDKIKVPGAEITRAIKNLYRQKIFSDVQIKAAKIYQNKIYLRIELKELSKISSVKITGVQKKEREDLMELIPTKSGDYYTSNLLKTIKRILENHYKAKGFYKNKVSISPKAEDDKVALLIAVSKTRKVKINRVIITGNEEVNPFKLKIAMKKTRDRSLLNFFKPKKFIEKKYEEDKIKLIEKYNELGYRDALILSDSIEHLENERVNIHIDLLEGKQYYINEITWVGNTIYPSELLDRFLKIKKGDVYNKKLLDKQLTEDDNSVYSLYSNNGYIFSNITMYETIKKENLINLEMRIYEGQQARFNKIIVKGNEKTNDHVVRRELYVKPGQLFSREKLKRSIRQISQLGHFDPERIVPDVEPNYDNNTVDLTFNLEEKSNDQVQLSGGYGGGTIIGSVGLRFSNFSFKNILNRESWSPLPVGDGQTFAISGQTNGSYYKSFNVSFVEPWLGGKKPNTFSISFLTSSQTRISSSYAVRNVDPDKDQRFGITRFTTGIGKRLKWPDSYFGVSSSLSYARYNLDNWPGFLAITDGNSNILSLGTTFFRNSTDNPIYTRAGSAFSIGVEFTPPYSAFNKDINYANASIEQKYTWIEYHKWSFSSKLYKTLDRTNKVVLYAGFEQGFLGYYDKNKRSPFEGYIVGGDGMTGYRTYGTDIIALRGYENSSLTPAQGVANLYSKMTMELRYPLSLSQNATIYILGFLEAGNSWYSFSNYEPFNLKRSAGVGVRIFLPIFGLLGIDWGYGFDEIPNNPNANGPQFHFVFGQQF